MDLDTVSASVFGQSLKGVGLNFLTQDVRRLAAFLEGVCAAKVHRLSDDFAIIVMGGSMVQLHHDATFRDHPLQGMLPDNPPRGIGAQFYVFGVDPDAAIGKAEAFGGTVLEPASHKPHGLYECTILSPEGYAFSPAIASEGA